MSEPDPIETALRYHRSGQLAEAMKIYRDVLSQKPDDHRTLHLLGAAESQCGRPRVAIDLIQRAIAIDSSVATYYNSLGSCLRDCGRFEEAIAACRRAIAMRPSFIEAFINLSNALRDAGQLDESIGTCRTAIALAPRNALIHQNLGAALFTKGDIEAAIRAYRQAIQLDPNDAAPFTDLALILYRAGQLPEAEVLCHQALKLKPDSAPAHNNFGLIRAAQGRLDEAETAYRKAIGLDPLRRDAYVNLGNLLYQTDRFDESATAYQEALRLKSDNAEVYNNLGASLLKAGRMDDAIAALEKAIQLRPQFIDARTTLGAALRDKLELDRSNQVFREAIQISSESAEAHFGLSLNLLIQGRFSEGWPEYEWRRRRPNAIAQTRSVFQKQWDGSELNGQIVLLHTEQGFGDAIQFARYAPMVADRGGRVILACAKPLARLFSQIRGVERVITDGEIPPHYDLHCPLLSLPLIFKTDLASIPNDVPYIVPDASFCDAWRSRLAGTKSSNRIGLVWSGSQEQARNKYRSMKFEHLAPLFEIPGITFVSLQKEQTGKQRPPPKVDFQDFAAGLGDFADTAALLSNLDLIITVDTAVAHLAGAMGKRVWVLLSHSPDWRWLLDRDDCPWYPTMRLFRQRILGGWTEPVNQVAGDLRAFARE